MSDTPIQTSGWACHVCGQPHAKGADAAVCCAAAKASTPSPNDMQVGGDHYKRMRVQPWDIVDTWPLAERIAFYRGNALKYLLRLNDKDTPATNARKAEHYCAKLAAVIEGD